MLPSDNGEAPVNRWATISDLAAVEDRLAKKIDEMSSRGWQIATLAVALIAVGSNLIGHLQIH
jgi:ABC-type cobalamin transport system ATPase subunit